MACDHLLVTDSLRACGQSPKLFPDPLEHISTQRMSGVDRLRQTNGCVYLRELSVETEGEDKLSSIFITKYL